MAPATLNSNATRPTRPRTHPASATQPAAPPIRGPDAPLTRFHAPDVPTCQPRPHSASKRHTANRDTTRPPAPSTSGAHPPTTAQPGPPHRHHTQPRTPTPHSLAHLRTHASTEDTIAPGTPGAHPPRPHPRRPQPNHTPPPSLVKRDTGESGPRHKTGKHGARNKPPRH